MAINRTRLNNLILGIQQKDPRLYEVLRDIIQDLEAQGGLDTATLEQMDTAWNIVKAKENNTSGHVLHRVPDRA